MLILIPLWLLNGERQYILLDISKKYIFYIKDTIIQVISESPIYQKC